MPGGGPRPSPEDSLKQPMWKSRAPRCIRPGGRAGHRRQPPAATVKWRRQAESGGRRAGRPRAGPPDSARPPRRPGGQGGMTAGRAPL
eukprot:6722675-Alexandrium_andersonii.AAC.1